jgi:hypothetical protein
MLHDVLGIALIGVGAVTMVARVMARAAELQRRGGRGAFHLAAEGAPPDSTPLRPRS